MISPCIWRIIITIAITIILSTAIGTDAGTNRYSVRGGSNLTHRQEIAYPTENTFHLIFPHFSISRSKIGAFPIAPNKHARTVPRNSLEWNQWLMLSCRPTQPESVKKSDSVPWVTTHDAMKGSNWPASKCFVLENPNSPLMAHSASSGHFQRFPLCT